MKRDQSASAHGCKGGTEAIGMKFNDWFENSFEKDPAIRRLRLWRERKDLKGLKGAEREAALFSGLLHNIAMNIPPSSYLLWDFWELETNKALLPVVAETLSPGFMEIVNEAFGLISAAEKNLPASTLRFRVGQYPPEIKAALVRLFEKNVDEIIGYGDQIRAKLSRPKFSAEMLVAIERKLKKMMAPVLLPQEGKKAGSRSGVGLLPMMAAGDSWPVGGVSKSSLFPLLQIEVGALPNSWRGVFPADFFQIFVSLDEHVNDLLETDEFYQIRLLKGPLRQAARFPPDLLKHVGKEKPTYFDGFVETLDAPSEEERKKLKLSTDEEYFLHQFDLPCPDPEKRDPALKGEFARRLDSLARPRSGDKIGGRPVWQQEPAFPRCGKCRARMEFLIQLSFLDGVRDYDSKGHGKGAFLADGSGYVFSCPRHRDIFKMTVQLD